MSHRCTTSNLVPVVSGSLWLVCNVCLKASLSGGTGHLPPFHLQGSLPNYADIQRKEIAVHGNGANLPRERPFIDSEYAPQICTQLCELAKKRTPAGMFAMCEYAGVPLLTAA